ncbi:LacI family transcriptional regulator [Xylanimonas oleitrophica]|uniref:LacI family transcriptional regulator n=1 Tax=Xylanimonas oleitrophica TaxID=2607479 RepID=A0A2W5WT52_9MICO|nr:LacI family transcriptional regulator [Xylanimonas oleitrophica]
MPEAASTALPTLDDVAREAGVSRSTASRAINGGSRVSPAAMSAVEDAVARLGYAPNRAARSLVTRRTGSIALVMSEPDRRLLSDPFLSAVLVGVNEGLAGTDLQLVLLLSRAGEPGRSARYLRSGHVDGAIVVSHHRDDRLETELAGGAMPVVFIGRPFDERVRTYVDADNLEGGRIAARRLVERGRRRIGTISGPLDMTAPLDRLAGWREVVTAAGLPDDAVVEGDFTVAGGAAGMELLLDRYPDLDAVFVASDLMAEGALRVLAAAGRRVPQDVAVVGFDDLGGAERTTPPLTTVHQPVVDLAAGATAALLELLDGGAPPSRTYPARLTEGGSA